MCITILLLYVKWPAGSRNPSDAHLRRSTESPIPGQQAGAQCSHKGWHHGAVGRKGCCSVTGTKAPKPWMQLPHGLPEGGGPSLQPVECIWCSNGIVKPWLPCVAPLGGICYSLHFFSSCFLDPPESSSVCSSVIVHFEKKHFLENSHAWNQLMSRCVLSQCWKTCSLEGLLFRPLSQTQKHKEIGQCSRMKHR